MSILRSLERLCRAAPLLLAAAPGLCADNVAAERARIAQERAQVEARARAGEATCAREFAVSACASRVRAERRAALQHLDRQRALLDDAQRKQRAAERLERLRQRQEASARTAARPQVEVKSRTPAATPPERAASVPGFADGARHGRGAASAVQARDVEAARRAAAAREREHKAAAHRAEVDKRNRDQALTKPAAPGLPLPPAASGAAR